MKWKEIVQLADFQGIAIGTLANIASGRIPKDPVLRARLHLAPQEECAQCWKFNKYLDVAIDESRSKRKITRWRDLPTETLRLALKYREEI